MVDTDRIWYLRREGQKKSIGPFSTEELLGRWQRGELPRNATGWHEGLLDWGPLAKLEPFASAMRVSLDADSVIRFRCECGNHIVMGEKFAGRMAKCSTCGRTVAVPDPYAAIEDDRAIKARRSRKRLIWPAVAICLIGASAVGYKYFGWNRGEPNETVAESRQGADVDTDEAPVDNVSSLATSSHLDEGDSMPPAGDGAATRGDGEATPSDGREEPSVSDKSGRMVDRGVEGAKSSGKDPAPSDAASRGDQRAVRDLVREFTAAFRVKGATGIDRLSEMLVDDCVLVSATGVMVSGKEETLAAFAETISENQKLFLRLNVRMSVEWEEISSHSAVVCGKLIWKGQLVNRGAAYSKSYVQTIALTKRADQWKILSIHSTSIPRRKPGAAG